MAVDAGTIIGWVLAGIIFVILVALLMTIPIWLLWNWLMPAIFGIKTITFWQALGVAFLSNILFGGACKKG